MSPLPGLAEAVAVLGRGGIVAFPTETTWGLAVNPLDGRALGSLFALKGRPLDKPVPCVLGSSDDVGLLASRTPDSFPPLIERFWPGPLTLLFPARSGLPAGLTDGRGLVGLRVSSEPVARMLAAAAGGVVTATSANISGQAPACTAEEVRRIFAGRVHILSDIECPGGCSTIAAESGGVPVIVRRGAIGGDELSPFM